MIVCPYFYQQIINTKTQLHAKFAHKKSRYPHWIPAFINYPPSRGKESPHQFFSSAAGSVFAIGLTFMNVRPFFTVNSTVPSTSA